jgi:hypothetical protein
MVAVNHDVSLASVMMAPVAIVIAIADANVQPIHADANAYVIRLRGRDGEGQAGCSDKSNCKCSHFETPVIASDTNHGSTGEVPELQR